MKNLNSKVLLEKYRLGTISDSEKALLEAWYNTQAIKSDIHLTEGEIDQDILKISQKILLPEANIRKLNKTGFIVKTLSAAAILVFISILSIRYFERSVEKTNPVVKIEKKITPAQNKAILTLANNKKIMLDDLSVGELAKQTGITISKTGDGKLKYKIIENGSQKTAQVQYNTISTPRGAQYQVELADGSLIWLNSSSSITFPTRFDGNTRSVKTTGEVYFEVAKNKNKPFFVKSGDQTIQVLGTHFNVDAHNKDVTRTTLVEGSVKLSFDRTENTTTLVPGQQSFYNSITSSLEVSKADIEKVLSWKNGYFLFKNDDLASIMEEVSRWYDVDITYAQNKPSNEKYSGTISRSKSLPEVLKVLEVSGHVNFKIDGRRITVMF